MNELFVQFHGMSKVYLIVFWIIVRQSTHEKWLNWNSH